MKNFIATILTAAAVSFAAAPAAVALTAEQQLQCEQYGDRAEFVMLMRLEGMPKENLIEVATARYGVEQTDVLDLIDVAYAKFEATDNEREIFFYTNVFIEMATDYCVSYYESQ